MKYTNKSISPRFGEAYRNDLFNLWWKNQKPSAPALQKMIPEEWGKVPSADSIRDWIAYGHGEEKSFRERAAILDRRMMDEVEGRMIQEKVEMLYRHGEIGRKMQKQAIEALEELDFEDFSPNALVRFLIEGVRIERESVGLPQALEKLLSADDSELLDRIEKLTEESKAEILVLDE